MSRCRESDSIKFRDPGVLDLLITVGFLSLPGLLPPAFVHLYPTAAIEYSRCEISPVRCLARLALVLVMETSIPRDRRGNLAELPLHLCQLLESSLFINISDYILIICRSRDKYWPTKISLESGYVVSV